MPISPVRFGVWALVHGSRAALQDPDEPYDASWARNKALVLEAERLGYDSVLVAQHTANPHNPELDQLEAWTASAAFAALTERIEIIAAIKPYLYHPVVLAKMAQQIEHISGGRFAINLVNAWNRPELERAGIGFAEHDARYAYGREWITVVDSLLRGERTRFNGEHFHIDDYLLRPADPFRSRPRIYVGGESEPARELVADKGDVWFINGQPLEDVERLIADVAARARPPAHSPLRFGLSAFVIARESDAEAERHLGHLFELAAKDTPLREQQKANTDPQAVMFRTFAQTPRVGSNGGTAAGLVGSYDTVARRIAAFHRAGIELFMLQFQPFETDMQRFAEQVAPRVRALIA
ncbi:LLM class flavin-dependent oxidoreductase [Paraburkholderia saeva]|uniref:FMNH(2)-dependent dimethylsulfone monooxygenase n=1 Tax=Paraburkholderia saeva TaxID=2777537 RepID=A0A9N8S0U3_9BURK|nr:LLM class flavin-dependent oxidoreductase [Paraburkholderia saeva]CAG4889102.1 FMNH(2)-dependent dimethylsulfone monooxygenase [Paraburkholderia saeva]CAG4903626.1 FMNH(2)-dependent dimethylsulfone monooxygenase [Paraburkholderia saeva]CAG4914532.1 FMNH(2)-dependent dimethylsulfone monooxygenase [Paraburkholderia saeva]